MVSARTKPWPEQTLVEEAVNVEHGEWYMVNVSRVRELSRNQPYELEDHLCSTTSHEP